MHKVQTVARAASLQAAPGVVLGFIAVVLTPFGLLANEKPNVVVIMADDIGFECYSHKGSEFYSTPNIDALAKTGVEFTQAYSQPICTPSRVRIMTGRYNIKNYVEFGLLPLKQPTFASMVRANGYATAIAGKWQLSPGDLQGPSQAGFDEFFLWHFSTAHGKHLKAKLPAALRDKGSRYKSPKLFHDGKLVPGTQGKFGPDLVTDFICDFIERKQDAPFLIYYPMLLTHSPFVPTPDSIDWERTDRKRKPVEHFQDMVRYMDKMIGKVVNKLDQTGLREKTLIIVTGDNGTHRQLSSPLPGRGMIQGGKGSMQDAGNRVAFVANWPGTLKAGTRVNSPIGFSDVLPTIAEVTGSLPPSGVDGQSLLPMMKGDSDAGRGWIFQSYSKNGSNSAPFRCFVRDADWKLYADGSLFNVPRDWLEESPVMGPDGERHRARLQPILDGILKDFPAELVDRQVPGS